MWNSSLEDKFAGKELSAMATSECQESSLQ